MAGTSTDGRTNRLFKVVVVGHTAVGRSSILLRYLKNVFSYRGQITVGVDFDMKTIKWDPKTTVKLQLWNINGLEYTRTRTASVYYRGAMGALIVFDITDRSTLEYAAKWKKDLDSVASQDSGNPIPAVLLANKCDLMEQKDRDKMVPSLDDFCKKNNFRGWFATSAKDNINIEEAVLFLVRQMMSSSVPLGEQRREDYCSTMAGISTDGRTDRLFKVLVIGDVHVGKTSFVLRYARKSFSDNYKTTVGVDFVLKTIEWDPKTVMRLQLWDISGQEQTRMMSRVYYKGAMGALIVCDITDKSTLDSAAEWKKDLDSNVSRDNGDPIPAVLLANKCDLMEQRDRENMEPSLDDFCKKNNFRGWFETSAKDNINIEEAGAFLVRQMMLSSSDLRDEQHREGIVRPGQGSGQRQATCC